MKGKKYENGRKNGYIKQHNPPNPIMCIIDIWTENASPGTSGNFTLLHGLGSIQEVPSKKHPSNMKKESKVEK